MLFSQRKGLKAAQKLAQVDKVDQELSNGLWSAVDLCYLRKVRFQGYDDDTASSNLELLMLEYWHGFFKLPVDKVPELFSEAVSVLRKFFFECEWNEVYDFIEFTAQNGPEEFKEEFCNFCNSVLERENSAYRLVNSEITQITSPAEIASIEDALDATAKFKGVHTHLETALHHLSDRKKPDYRNSVKESISAVEGICQILTGDSHTTLGAALSVLEKKMKLHGALKSSFSSLYGYTSDADGIRHAMLKETDLTFVDAKYMLVTCTAFVNYIVGKAAEMGISF